MFHEFNSGVIFYSAVCNFVIVDTEMSKLLQAAILPLGHINSMSGFF